MRPWLAAASALLAAVVLAPAAGAKELAAHGMLHPLGVEPLRLGAMNATGASEAAESLPRVSPRASARGPVP